MIGPIRLKRLKISFLAARHRHARIADGGQLPGPATDRQPAGVCPEGELTQHRNRRGSERN